MDLHILRLEHVSGRTLHVHPRAIVCYHEGRQGTELVLNCHHDLARPARAKGRWYMTVTNPWDDIHAAYEWLADLATEEPTKPIYGTGSVDDLPEDLGAWEPIEPLRFGNYWEDEYEDGGPDRGA